MKFFFFGLTLAFTLFFGATAYALPDTGLETTARNAGLLDTSPKDVPTLIGNVIGTLLSMVGVLFFLLMLYGGVLWMTARGNEDQTTKSMHTIIAASIGIVIVLASYALTNFVFESVKDQKGVGGGAAAGAPAAPGGGGNRLPGAPSRCRDAQDEGQCDFTIQDGVQCVWVNDPDVPLLSFCDFPLQEPPPRDPAAVCNECCQRACDPGIERRDLCVNNCGVGESSGGYDFSHDNDPSNGRENDVCQADCQELR